MKLNLRYGLTTLAVSMTSSALLALCLKQGGFVYDLVGPLDDRFYLMSGTAWHLWRADTALMLLIAVLALSVRSLPVTNALTVKTVLRLTVWPVAAVSAFTCTLRFIMNGSASGTSAFWLSLIFGILLAQVMYSVFIFHNEPHPLNGSIPHGIRERKYCKRNVRNALMATKHINDEIWSRIEALTVRANGQRGLLRSVKEADVMGLVLSRGLESVSDDDLRQLGQYRRPLGFILRQQHAESPQRIDSLHPSEVVSLARRAGPATLCLWSIDDVLRRAAEDVLRSMMPDVEILSEGDDADAFRSALPAFWHAAHRGDTAVISLRSSGHDAAIARIVDEMSASQLSRQDPPYENEQC